MPIPDRKSIFYEFHSAFHQIYSRQDVDDSSEAIKEFFDSGGDTKSPEYLNSKVLADEESKGIEGEITLSEMTGSSASGNYGFTVNWLRKYWDSLKLVTLIATNEWFKKGL